MNVTVKVEGLKELQRELGIVGRDGVGFAAVVMLSRLALGARDQIRRAILPQHFTLRRPSFLKQGVRAIRATKQTLESFVEDIDPFMVLQEEGGEKIPYKEFLAIPLVGARPTLRALIRPEDRPDAVMQQGGFIRGQIMYRPEVVHAILKGGRRAVGKRLAAAADRGGIVPMYALVKSAHIPKRYGMQEAVEQFVEENYRAEFVRAAGQYVK